MTKPTTTQNNTATVGAQFIAPEASPEHGQKGGVSGWREYELQELVDVRDGTHDSPKESAIGKHLVTSKHIKNGKIDLTSAYKISENDFELVNKRSKVDQWDILFSMIGTIGEMAIVTDRPEFAIKNVGLFKTNGNKLLSQWIYYYFKSTEAQAEIQASLKGSTQQYITLGDLRVFPIKIPSEKEQKAIAAMLSSLDDKIDLLHRQNQTLEAMAQTLFRQWFVEEAREDWEEVALGDLISIKGGTTPSTKEPKFWNGSICWTSPRDLSAHSSVYMFDTERKITEEGLSQIGSGLLPIGTVLLSSRAPIGYLAIAEIPLAINQGYIAIICDKTVSNLYMFLWCKENMETIKNAGNGSTFEEISKSNFRDLLTKKPPKSLLLDFDTKVFPIFKRIKTNQQQIQTLTQLRDTLLTKLMSGEIRVEVEYE